MELVDEDDVQSLRLGDLLEDRLEPFLELPAELRAGDETSQIQSNEPLVLESLGDVAIHDALRQSFDDGGLSDAGLADEDWVVLRAARQHLNHAADLLVAADHRIELPLARGIGEIARVFLERLVLILRALVGDAVTAPHRFKRLEQLVAGDAHAAEEIARLGLGAGERNEQVLSRDVLVAKFLRFVLGLVEDLIQLTREIGLGVALLRVAVDLAPHLVAERGDADTELLQDGHDDALVLIEQRRKQMKVVDDRVPVATSEGYRVVEGFARLHGESFGVDHGAEGEVVGLCPLPAH